MLDLLKGVRVVELSTIVLGPMAGQLLADFGADVIKVEAPAGDLARAVEPRAPSGESAMFVNCNRNKRSLAVDLKTEEGREMLRRLVRESDVFLHNMRLKAVERLGLSAGALREINPGLIYCSAIGFGSAGPYADRPAYDDVIQAASGIAHLPTYAGGEPAYVPGVIADKITALYAAHAVCAALYERSRSGRGVEIEVPMFEVMSSFVMTEHLAAATFAGDARPGYGRLLNRHRRPFRSKDGWIAVLPYSERHWRRTLKEIGREEVTREAWFDDASERSKRTELLYGILAEGLGSRTTEEWIEAFERIDVPHSKVSTLGDLLADPHLRATGFFEPSDDLPIRVRSVPQPVEIHGAGRVPDRSAPRLGSDGRSIAEALGYGSDEIHGLVSRGVLSLHEGGED